MTNDYLSSAQSRLAYDEEQEDGLPTGSVPGGVEVNKELVEEVRAMTSSELSKIRAHAENDLYFFSKGVLGYKDINPFTHGPLIRFMQNEQKRRRLALMPRGHLKSTICTIAHSLQRALANPDHERILILNEVELNAIGFVSEIKAHVETNELVHLLWPGCIPERFAGPGAKWGAAGANLRRATAYKEFTFNAIGVGGAVTSRHFTRLKPDDLIGLAAKESPALMQSTITYAKNLEPLLINPDEDWIDFVGTRYLIHDLYAAMMAAYGEDLAIFTREDIENGQPIFLQKYSLGRLARLQQIDPVMYYAQYKNNPIADGQKDFTTHRIQLFSFAWNGDVVYRDQQGFIQRWPRESLDIIMTCDPNSGSLSAPDYPAIVVSAQSPDEQIFVLETWRRRVEPDAFVDMIYELYQRWQPRAVGIEKAGQQSTLFYFKKKARDTGTYIHALPLTPKNRDKPSRIRKALQPIINQGRLYMLKDSQTELRQEIEFHPDVGNDDLIDALSYGVEDGMWQKPDTNDDREEEEELIGKVLTARNPRTGYGG